MDTPKLLDELLHEEEQPHKKRLLKSPGPKPVETTAETDNTPIPSYTRSEVNFLRYPFFVLNSRDVGKIDRIEYREERQDNNQIQQVYWKVSRNIDHFIPGPFDKRVYRAIEEILDGIARPVPQLVRIGSLYSLCKLMDIPDSGKNLQMIKKALRRMAATTIDSDNAFYDKSQRRWLSSTLEGTFHLFDVYLKGQRLPNGDTADTLFLFLNPLYILSINAFYVKPLDHAYMRQLNNPVTERFYEVLGLKFRGLKNSPYIRYRYPDLCHVLPVTPQRLLKNAKKIFSPHHEKLRTTGFLAKVEWRGSQSQQPWEILYWPGKRAAEEMKRAREVLRSDRNGHQLTDGQERLLYWILDVCGDPENERAYRKIIHEYSEGDIETALGETKQAKAEHRIHKRPGAYFIDVLKRVSVMRAQAR
jgi:Replication initiator protein A